jgi:hypothetical protein
LMVARVVVRAVAWSMMVAAAVAAAAAVISGCWGCYLCAPLAEGHQW